MKKFLLFFQVTLVTLFLAVSCNQKIDDNKPLGDEFLVDFEGSYWDGLIDNPQYGGDLMYGPCDEYYCYSSQYKWTDAVSGFSFEGFPESWGSLSFSGGGEAVSNYVNADFAGADYMRQLEVPVAPAKGANFAVHFGSGEPYPMLRLADGGIFILKSMDVIMTSYLADAAINGNAYFGPLSEENSHVSVRVIGFDKDGNKTGSIERVLVDVASVPLYKSGSKKLDWEKWDTSSLGKVSSVAFEVYGSADCYGDYGFNAPGYFAYDNVVIVKPEAE